VPWWLFYPAWPGWVILRTSEKNNNARINDGVSMAMAGRSHKSFFFQCDAKIDIHFFVPCFLSGGTIIRQ
jgi:hypothetical protein